MNRLNSLHHRVANDQNGTIAIVFSFLLLVFCILLGLSIDGGRAIMTRNEMADALDSATLAATRALMTGNPTDAEITDLATTYFEKNLSNRGEFGATHDPLVVVIDRQTKTVTLRADGHMPTTFAAITSKKVVDLSVDSQATYSVNDIELGLVLDTTGSMSQPSNGAGGKAKIDELKVAAAKMFDILLPDKGTASDTRIGIAPFAAAINAGNFANVVSHGASNDDCVVERIGADAHDDADPLPNKEQLEVAGKINGKKSIGSYSCPNGTVLPLTNDKVVLKAKVNGLGANGSTAGHLGTAWGWYLVSPNWNDVWAGAGLAKPYGVKNNIKSIVLMTDGAYNTQYNGAASANQAVDLCNNAKAAGVIVYTIGFTTLPGDEATLTACASIDPTTGKPGFYHAENGADLTAAFSDIAVKLGQLRVTQ